jgi:chromosome segregation ATPase
LKRARTTASSREPLVDESIVIDLEAKIEQLTNLCQTYKKSHDELEGIVKSNEELTTAYENKIQDNQKEIDDLKLQCQGYRISQEETESLFELSYQEAKAKDLADYELKLSENEERIHQLTALCDLYKRSHEEAEQRYQEASSKEQLTSADILKLQEEHDTSVRKLNAELEINIIREKTKGETTLFEVTQELNALKLENASLEAKYKLIADEKEELSQKHLVALDQISHLEINKETQGQNEQLQAELANQQERIRELELQISNNGILLDEYKRSNADLNAKFAEEKVTLTLELDTNRETVKELVDKRDELEALNHKLVIERDLLKQLNEEADERQNSRKATSDEHEPTETVEEIKLEFSNQTRRLNAEMEIKLLEERAAGEKSVLDIKREYNDLKTLHEYLNSRYNILVEEKKMFVTEINHYKQQSREIRLEKDKLEESLKDVRSEKSTETNSCPPRPPPPPPPPPSLNDKSDEIVARYEREIDELQQQYEVISKQCETVTSQRDEYKSALNAMESDKTNWEATMEDKENSFAKLKAESEMYKSKYEESEVRFHVWENESESKGKIWTQSMKELQMLHESQVRKLTVKFEIQILEERSKGEQKLFATVSKLNSLKVTLSQKEAELNIKYDTLLAEKETLEKSYHNLQDKLSNVRDNVSKDSVVNQQDQRPERPSKARFTHNEADLLKTQLFSIIKRFDDNDTPPNSPPDSSDDDTPPNSPPPSDDEGGF